MVALTSLLLPIVLAAVAVFIASALINMLPLWHSNDFRKLPDEESARVALRGTPPGDYVVPHAAGMAAMKEPDHTRKLGEGPIAFLTVAPAGSWSMGPSLALWFAFCLVVSVFAGYIAGRALGPGANYLEVFRFAGATAFAGYALALWQNTIWYRRPALNTLKSTFDGLIYALLTAGVFGWLWPDLL
jgi:hypothetical protein